MDEGGRTNSIATGTILSTVDVDVVNVNVGSRNTVTADGNGHIDNSWWWCNLL